MANQTIDMNTIALYDYLFRTTDNGILIADDSGKITHMNSAAAAMLGITVEDCIGRDVRKVFYKNRAVMNLFERDGEQKLDVRLPRRRLAQGVADTIDGGIRVLILQDVTERRDIENRREMLSRTIAHDLRNPISAIRGFTDLVGKFGELTPQQHKYLNRARQTSSKLHDMIVTLVDLAWIEAGMPLNHVPIRLDKAVERGVNEVRAIAHKNKISVAVSVQRPLPVVMGDPERLHLVIYHLLHNAIIYSKSEGSIAIHAWSDQHDVYCSVADQGIGIMDSELELIFDRMYRSRDEHVREIPGGGLGLTFARTIINRLGGDIWASSNPGEGSTFTFVLPSVQL